MSNDIQTLNLIDFYRFLKKDDLQEESNAKNVFRFLEAKARAKGIPLSGSFELTPLCNLDCKMCYIHLNNKQLNKQLLPSDEWKNLITQAHKFGMIRASLTGGECLTYPAFDDIYMHLYHLGIRPSILSNGILLDEKRIDFFRKHPPRRIQITLYGSTDETYESVTGHRVFELVYEHILSAKNAGLPIAISITPNEYMYNDIRSLLKTAVELQLPYYINSSLKPPRKNTGRTEHDLTDEQYIELYRIANEISNSSLTEIDSSELPDVNHEAHKRHGLRCGGGRSAFVMTYDGQICPCHSLYETRVDAIKMGFSEAWKQLNALANNYPIPGECISCKYRDVCLTCPAMHTHAPAIGHCDPRICERTKKLVMAGIIPLPK